MENVSQDGVRVMKYNIGDIYYGQLKGRVRHGDGVYTWFDGRKYKGQWKDGVRHGQGK